MVRLITHNVLACHAKGCDANNFPLKLTNVKLALREAEFNPDFLRGFLPKLEWAALIQSSREVSAKSVDIERTRAPIVAVKMRSVIRRFH
jgi:multifunctional methyltransferase subunit TRM112